MPRTDRAELEFVEEKIAVGVFKSSESLKKEIGQRIGDRLKKGWDFVRLKSAGPFIYLIFRHRPSGCS